MDAHSGGMSGSTSNSKLVKTSLGSSIRRPVVHGGPLEHQLPPAIQQGSYRPTLLDRMVNNLDHLLGANDHAHPHSPSINPSSSLVDNINHHLPHRTLNINPPCDSPIPTHSHNRIIGASVGLAITIILSISICLWVIQRCRRDRNARNTDMEAAQVVDEAILAPKHDAEPANTNPFADPDAGFVSRL